MRHISIILRGLHLDTTAATELGGGEVKVEDLCSTPQKDEQMMNTDELHGNLMEFQNIIKYL